jgi:xanthine dehydrogenase accessory factor
MLRCASAIRMDGQPDCLEGRFAADDAPTPLEVLRFVMEAAQRGQRVALVTIIGLTGSSCRSLGTIMDVAEDGRFVGSLSGGCPRPLSSLRSREAGGAAQFDKAMIARGRVGHRTSSRRPIRKPQKTEKAAK